ncbi:secondary thiamine-phosphate synthase enzyme YjbQ [Halorussus gelatinilyticus]|uniref:Secondary thiamine-phosphate synthase enzyme YjbQ n=1 Tax=Halorussus gelatinilyticus TaxID=2937524 RepID=A0A8U0IHU5_9EURY|nr:secondary thiamine-phosphate synthase enzyme YjbQ [Halorussus gelatinilyticus]UPW00573.1 secondary thiamine-phosphate synthase enzyme YjbQ [Halorussus gelatinilyticus]
MFDVETDRRTQVVDVTDRVAAEIPDDATGLCTVFVRHTTAGVVLQEAESGLLDDIEAFAEGLAPSDGDYRHDRIDDNADAHLRATVLGESVSVPVEDGELALGTWQSVLFVECDGPRTRQVEVVVTE